MIHFKNPIYSVDGADTEEVEAICQLLKKKKKKGESTGIRVQIDGYGEDIHPKPEFDTRFEATLKIVNQMLNPEGLIVSGYYSKGDPWCQPFSCWVFFEDRWICDSEGEWILK